MTTGKTIALTIQIFVGPQALGCNYIYKLGAITPLLKYLSNGSLILLKVRITVLPWSAKPPDLPHCCLTPTFLILSDLPTGPACWLFPLARCFSVAPASLLLLKHTKHTAASVPLHLPFPLLGSLSCPYIYTICFQVLAQTSARPFLTTLSHTETTLPLHMPPSFLSYFYSMYYHLVYYIQFTYFAYCLSPHNKT